MWTPETKTDKNLTLWVTHECNLNCVFCRDSDNKLTKGFMTMEEVESSLIHAKEKGITTILIGGGEPTLHPNVIEIAKMCKSMGFCCMRGHTKWCEKHKEIEWLDSLPIEKVVMTDRGNPCWIYRGYPIDRKDLSILKKPHMMADVRGLLYDENGKWVLY